MKDQDRKLRSKINNFSFPPSENVWSEIEKKLQDQSERILFPIHLKAIFALASLVGLVLIIWITKVEDEKQIISSALSNSKGVVEDLDNKKIDDIKLSKESLTIKNTNQHQSNKKLLSLIEQGRTKQDAQSIASKSSTQKGVFYHEIERGLDALKPMQSPTQISHVFEGFNNYQKESYVDKTMNYEILPSIALPTKYVNPSNEPILKLKTIQKAIGANIIIPKKRMFFTEMYGGIDKINRKISSERPEFESWASAREKSESALLSFNAGVMAGVKLSNKMIIMFGLGYNVDNYEFNYKSSSSVWKSARVIVDTFFTNPNNPEIVYQNIQYTETGVFNAKVFNRLHSLQIPVKVGYEIAKGHWRLSPYTGISTGVLLHTRGQVVSRTGNTVNLAYNSGDNPYKLGLLANLMIGGMIGYNVFERTQIMLDLNYQKQVFSMTNASYPLKENISRYSIKLGIRRAI